MGGATKKVRGGICPDSHRIEKKPTWMENWDDACQQVLHFEYETTLQTLCGETTRMYVPSWILQFTLNIVTPLGSKQKLTPESNRMLVLTSDTRMRCNRGREKQEALSPVVGLGWDICSKEFLQRGSSSFHHFIYLTLHPKDDLVNQINSFSCMEKCSMMGLCTWDISGNERERPSEGRGRPSSLGCAALRRWEMRATNHPRARSIGRKTCYPPRPPASNWWWDVWIGGYFMLQYGHSILNNNLKSGKSDWRFSMIRVVR